MSRPVPASDRAPGRPRQGHRRARARRATGWLLLAGLCALQAAPTAPPEEAQRALQGAAVAASAEATAPAADPSAARTAERTWRRLAEAHLPVTAERLRRLGSDRTGRWVERSGTAPDAPRITYSLHPALQRHALGLLERGRVERGHVLVADARSGRLLVYAASDAEALPPTRRYPAASLVKIVTAAATLRNAPERTRIECSFRGNPYRLTRARLTPARRGRRASFRRALADSNNQCFAQLAVHALGPATLLGQLAAFGWLSSPAPGHSAGRISTGSDPLDLGRLGSGLAGSEITPLHALQLALFLAGGRILEPFWIDGITAPTGELRRPTRPSGDALLSPDELAQLRELLVETTRTGTARRAFRLRSGRPLLTPVTVAGKTGSLSGDDPPGRYEWFVGVAPAEDPRIAIAALTVQSDLWWTTASQLASELLKRVFCPGGLCSAQAGTRWLAPPRPIALPRPRPGAHSPGARPQASPGSGRALPEPG